MKTKKVNAYEVEELLKQLQERYDSVLATNNLDHPFAHSMALGQAEAVIEHTIDRLKYILQ